MSLFDSGRSMREVSGDVGAKRIVEVICTRERADWSVGDLRGAGGKHLAGIYQQVLDNADGRA